MMNDRCWKGRGEQGEFIGGVPGEVPRYNDLQSLVTEMACCTRCDLALSRTQVVAGAGSESARLIFIGEAPGAAEDRAGRPFIGRSGQLLDRLLASIDLEREDIYITNIVACRPPKNRDPYSREISAHTPWIEEQLLLISPELIVTLGRVALNYFIPGAQITELTGKVQEIEKSGSRISLLPLFHPAAALRRPELVPVLEEGFALIPALISGPGTPS